MKAKFWILTICTVSVLFFQTGCQEKEKQVSHETLATEGTDEVIVPKPEVVEQDVATREVAIQEATAKKGPTLTFKSSIYDFGIIGPSTKNTAGFKFTNTGDEVLKITEIKSTCGCTVPKLAKKEYAPGESGVIKVEYKSKKEAKKDTQTVTVYSNDKQNPRITLTLKAEIILKVAVEPEVLKLELWKDNGNCPRITLKSKDGRPFSITKFSATKSAMTIDFDPNAVDVNFVFEPVIDVSKLENVPRGAARFTLTHPECTQITQRFELKQKYELNRKLIYILNTITDNAKTEKLWVISNSGQEFEIAETSSRQGYVELLSKKKVGNRYELELQITPPPKDGTKRFFVDTFYVTMEDGAKLMTTVQGYYKKEAK